MLYTIFGSLEGEDKGKRGKSVFGCNNDALQTAHVDDS